MASNIFDPSEIASDHYKLLGVSHNATPEEIDRAFKVQALRHHPDKAGEHNTKVFQKILKARETLLNGLQRSKYDEEHEDDFEFESAGALTHGTLLSELFLKKVTEWKSEFIIIPKSSLGKFPQALQEMLLKFSNGFLKDQCAKCDPLALDELPSARRHKQMHTPLEGIVSFTEKAASRVKTDAAKEQSSLAKIYKHAVSHGNNVDQNIDIAPIVDFSSTPTRDIQFLVGLLSADGTDETKDMNRLQLLGRLSKFVPSKPFNYLLESGTSSSQPNPTQCGKCQKRFWLFQRPQHACIWCKNSFCKSCPINKMKLYGFGVTGEHYICNPCVNSYYKQHANEWLVRSIFFLKAGSLEDLNAAFGCMKISLCLVENKNLMAFGRELIQQNLPELALPIVIAVQQQSVQVIDKVKANHFLSSALKCFAQKFSNWDIRWPLLVAAKEACLEAKTQALFLDSSSTDTHSLESALEELNDLLLSGHVIKEQAEKSLAKKKKQIIEELWNARDLSSMIEFIKVPDYEDPYNYTLIALEQFLQDKEAFFSKLLPEDRYSLIFFRGVLKIHRHRFLEGISDIEQVVWYAHSLEVLKLEAINILVSLLQNNVPFFTLKGMHTTLTSNQYVEQHKTPYNTSRSSREFQLLFPNEKEITPPFSRKWPELSVIGLNLRAHHKCEEAFEKQLRNGEWGHRDVGFAYINYIQGCVHPAESAVSLLHASMWFLQDLKVNVHMPPPEKFAFKKLVLDCLSLAYSIAHMSLHPGMQLYVGRLALKVALEVAHISKDFALPEDTQLVSSLLHTITYNSRFVPFWDIPSVPVSEAVLLSIVSAKSHCQYLDELHHMDPKERPMTEAELHYQMYENDLRCVHSVQHPGKVHIKAMEELLSEKGWTMADVADLMTSLLTLRDQEGWLVPQPQLYSPQEYAEIKGLVINTDQDNPSIKLVVVPADYSRGRSGMFNQTDFQDVVSMVLDEKCDGTLFFSLDQPDSNKRFHPFQEFRYPSESLQKTDVLHTLFETDYLLKSFSVGTEVSAKPPFKQRLNTKGLTKELPQHLKHKLRPVSERGATGNKAHRFWIQADKIVYDEKQEGSKLEIRLGEMSMIVRSHPLLPGNDGKLEDTQKDEDPDSPEAKFAADLTANYNELGLHFPLFTRLKVLAKLQVLGLFLRGILKGMKDKAEGKDITVSDELIQSIHREHLEKIKEKLRSNLDSISTEIGTWPAADDYTTVSAGVRRILDELPSNVYASYSDVEPYVKKALRQKDETTLTHIVDGLLESVGQRLARSTLTSYVRSWLANRTSVNKNNLADYVSSAVPLSSRDTIKQQIMSIYQEKHDAFRRSLTQLRSCKNQQTTNPCKWVPAALRRESDSEHLSLCYGGVLIAPEITQGRVSRFPRHSRQVIVCQASSYPSRASNALWFPSRAHGKPTTTKRGVAKSNILPTILTATSASGSGSPPKRPPTRPNFRPPTPPSSSSSSPSSTPPRRRTSSSTSHPESPHSVPAANKEERKKWKINEQYTEQADWMRLGKHVPELLQNIYVDEDNDSNSNSRNPSSKIVAATALGLSVYCIKKVLNVFGDKNTKAGPAFNEVNNTLDVNPCCKRKKCPSCKFTDLTPVTSFQSSNGATYKCQPTKIPMDTRYIVYMLQCKITGKMYIGMTTREAFVRIREHLRDIAKQRSKTVPKHFNSIGCFGQFEQYMNVSPIAFVRKETMESYSLRERKKIMESIERGFILLIGEENVMNAVTPNPRFDDCRFRPERFFTMTDQGEVFVDGNLVFKAD